MRTQFYVPKLFRPCKIMLRQLKTGEVGRGGGPEGEKYEREKGREPHSFSPIRGSLRGNSFDG